MLRPCCYRHSCSVCVLVFSEVFGHFILCSCVVFFVLCHDIVYNFLIHHCYSAAEVVSTSGIAGRLCVCVCVCGSRLEHMMGGLTVSGVQSVAPGQSLLFTWIVVAGKLWASRTAWIA